MPKRRRKESEKTDVLSWDEYQLLISGLRNPNVADVVEIQPVFLPPTGSDNRRRRFLGWFLPSAIATVLIGAYVAATLMWSLDAIVPTVEEHTVAAPVAPAYTAPVPIHGTLAYAIEQRDVTASDARVVPIASISKIVTVLMVLEKEPLAAGENGRSFSFVLKDNLEYWKYVASNQSALDVPVGATLSLRQMLEGILLGSANNYTDRLAKFYWPGKGEFEKAAARWLAEHDLTPITIVSPSGFSKENTATAESIVRLGRLALADPTIAEIVATKVVTLPGAGEVKNSNPLLADKGVVGIKTGTYFEHWNLLSAKEISVAGTHVLVTSAVLSEPDRKTRDAVARSIYSSIEAAFASAPSVPQGTTIATLRMPWDTSAEIVTAAPTRVPLWDGEQSEVSQEHSIAKGFGEGKEVGSLTLRSSFTTAKTPLVIAGDLGEPDAWWRLTHPFELWGLR